MIDAVDGLRYEDAELGLYTSVDFPVTGGPGGPEGGAACT
jgi:hypothetical protein